MMNLIKYIPKLFRKKDEKVNDFLTSIHSNTGLWWNDIERFGKKMEEFGAVKQSCYKLSDEVEEMFPTKNHIEGGLFTREIFFPKGSVVVSLIHKQAHPSFLLEGKVSVINDQGEVKKLKTGEIVFTQIGAQRIFYAHEDTKWCCVYKTNKKTVQEAMADVYCDNYLELPPKFLKEYYKNKKKELWQESF